jgi:hypothetical protein
MKLLFFITRYDFVASGLRMPTFHIEDPVFLDSCNFFDFLWEFFVFFILLMLNFLPGARCEKVVPGLGATNLLLLLFLLLLLPVSEFVQTF